MKKIILLAAVFITSVSTCYADKASYEAELAVRKARRISYRMARARVSKNVYPKVLVTPYYYGGYIRNVYPYWGRYSRNMAGYFKYYWGGY